ncbi:MAG: peptidoglycan DL-endopeptidase LytE [Clostridiales bacterium]|nr:peptidoglycan DL-endopeptidase LytE [Clostridiales bacterium]
MLRGTARLFCTAFAFVFILAVLVFPGDVHAQGTLLKMGSRGAEVKKMQQALIEQGFLSGKADGIFGPLTRAAVMAFQRAKGLVVDGIAGPKTLNALYGSESFTGGNSSDEQPSRSATISRTLRLGDRGQDVAILQNRLNQLKFNCGKADGIFGPTTYAAVVAFQKKNGLVADGIVGPKTLAVLFDNGVSTGENPPASLPDEEPSRGAGISRALRLGDRGEDVAVLQRRLNELKFNCGKADGIFGHATYAAVKAFQKANGLIADGIVGKNTIAKLYSSDVVTGDAAAGGGPSPESKADEIVAFAKKYIGKPYVYGASGPDSFDCSGFTTFVYRHFGISLKRTAWDQGNDSSFARLSRQQLNKGDLVFFDTSTSTQTRYHVGIYIGGGEFIHASSAAGNVRIDTLDSGYYQQRFKWGLRVLN